MPTATRPTVSQVLHKARTHEAISQRERQELGRTIFKMWCREYSIWIAAALRLYDDIKLRGISRKLDLPPKPWLDAAYVLLNFGSDVLKDQFLRGSPRLKDRLIDAILADGGVEDDRGRWQGILA